MRKSAFTLSELLIALAVLGLIAAFTIPKVLQATSTNQRDAVLKESIASLNSVVYQGFLTGENHDAVWQEYAFDNLNTVHTCPNNSSTEGCWSTDTSANYCARRTEPGVVLANGTFIAGLDSQGGNDYADGLCIDWNGFDGPNADGEDGLSLVLYFRTNSATERGGTLLPVGGISTGLYESLYRQ